MLVMGATGRFAGSMVVPELVKRGRQQRGAIQRAVEHIRGLPGPINKLVDASSHRPYLEFVAHGMGLSHEAPRLISDGPVP